MLQHNVTTMGTSYVRNGAPEGHAEEWLINMALRATGIQTCSYFPKFNYPLNLTTGNERMST